MTAASAHYTTCTQCLQGRRCMCCLFNAAQMPTHCKSVAVQPIWHVRCILRRCSLEAMRALEHLHSCVREIPLLAESVQQREGPGHVVWQLLGEEVVCCRVSPPASSSIGADRTG